MGWMTPFINACNSAVSWCYEIYLDVNGWVWPFYVTAPFFYWLSETFADLSWAFYDFGNWIDYVASQVTQILSWSTIWSYILSYVPNLTQLRDWFYNWWTNVTSVVTSWWSSMQWTVQGWISTAVQPFNAMLTAWNNFWNNTWPSWVTNFNSLQVAWNNFWTVTFPTLVNFTWLTTWWDSRLLDVQVLIGSAFTLREGLWAGWQDWKGSVAEFFTDPEQWVYDRLDSFFERFW